MKNIKFSPPDISELEIEYVVDALRSGWITTGPKVKKLEKLLAGYIGVGDTTPNCVCLNSQTACGEMSLRLLGIGRNSFGIDGIVGSENDEVVTCAYTYTATASVVYHVGAKLVLVDCQKGDIHINYDAIENAITENTKAIIPIDIAGIPCDYDRLYDIVERKKHLFKPNNKIQSALGRVAIVCDGAHALGASYKGKMVGSIADFTNFSFHAVKNLTTAEGGAMSWKSILGIDDSEIYKFAQLYSLHGQSKDALAKTRLGAWEYDVIGPWYKCNMTDIMAAIGLGQLERYQTMLKKRRDIILCYESALKPIGINTAVHYSENYISSGHLFLTRIPNISIDKRQEIIIQMAKFGIATNVHYKPLPMHTAYKNEFDINDYPNAFTMFENEITLPLHTKMNQEDVEYLLSKYIDCLK